MKPHLIVIAKSPVAGRVKTRLCPPYSLEHAARIAEACLADTLEVIAETPASTRTIVLDGAVGPWLPTGFNVIGQRGDSLDQRLAAAFEDVEQASAGPMLLVGMDTPQITVELMTHSADLLLQPQNDAVLGPASDGGWWALGLRHADARLVLGVPMSTPTTWADQHARLREHGLQVADLPELTDVDDARTAAVIADLIPSSRFARSLDVLETV